MHKPQLLKNYFEKNCELYRSASGSQSADGTLMTAPTKLGDDCSYSESNSFSSSSLMWKVWAHTAGQCCKACAATNGCNAAYFTKGDIDPSHGGDHPGPQDYEGFGLHTVDVVDAKTDGGLDVPEVEKHFTARFAAAFGSPNTTYDAFMDYNVVLFAGENLPAYAKALHGDGHKLLTATWQGALPPDWKANSTQTWYSVLVQAPHSQMILELVSTTSPCLQGTGICKTSGGLVQLEPRLSPKQVARFNSASAGGILTNVAVTRAVSNMTAIELFYTNAVQAKTTHTLDDNGVTRRCFEWSTEAKSDVCFVSRQGKWAYDNTFSVRDMEINLWRVHKAVDTNVNVTSDQYHDNHYAVDLSDYKGDNLAAWLKNNYDQAFPIDFPDKTYFAWNCMQSYLIDYTGWAVQSDFDSATWPGCPPRPTPPHGYKKRASEPRKEIM